MFSNSETTNYLSFKGNKDYDGPPKVGFESLASPGQVITITTAQDFNSNLKPYSTSILQTDIGCKQAGPGYTMTTYTTKEFDPSSVYNPYDKRTSSVSNTTSQNISVTMGSPFSHLSGLKHQSLTNSPLANANKAFVGTTDLRSASKPPEGPAQLTIFYAGSVCVYDDVSPEKAQAIMLLAGNGNSPKNPPNKAPTPVPAPTTTSSITTRLDTQAQRPLSRANSSLSNNYLSNNNANSFISNRDLSSNKATNIISNKKLSNNHATPVRLSSFPSPIPISVSLPRPTISFMGNDPQRTACTNFPSPISISSLSSGASLASPSGNPEFCQLDFSQGARVSTTGTTNSSAVPQARKASLARFMEKRKDRAIFAAPYPSPVKESQECGTHGSQNRSFPISSASSFSLSFTK